ncbi:MAG: histidine--tRNA ligase [Candidatus Aenigmatarchaeota archaeon]
MGRLSIKPPKGTRDLFGEEAIIFEKLIDNIKNIFEKYGFEPLYTPSFESFELLSVKGGLGEAVKDEIYYFKDKSERELGLRFDLTMPLVRFISNNPNIPKPYKRYAIGPVWRYDNPQAYRYREFWQADIDIVGSYSPISDAECLACVSEILESLGIKDFVIRINDRRVLEKLLIEKVPLEKINQVFRILDKMDKIGKEGVSKELENLGIDSSIINTLDIGGIFEEVLRYLEEKCYDCVRDLKQLYEYCSYYGIEKKLKLDLFLVRGLDYYTSFVFEIDLGKRISFGGGGRYDNLIEILSGEKVPATGISIGLSRLFDYIKETGRFKTKDFRVYVAYLKKLEKEAIGIVQELRRNGFIADINLIERKLDKQLEYADKKNYKLAIIIGEKETKEGKIIVKDMEKREEFSIDRKRILEFLKKRI